MGCLSHRMKRSYEIAAKAGLMRSGESRARPIGRLAPAPIGSRAAAESRGWSITCGRRSLAAANRETARQRDPSQPERGLGFMIRPFGIRPFGLLARMVTAQSHSAAALALATPSAGPIILVATACGGPRGSLERDCQVAWNRREVERLANEVT